MDRASDTTKRSAVCSLVLSAVNLESFIGPQVISSSLYGCVQCINTIYPGLGNEFFYYLISKSLACVETYGSSPTLKAAFQSQCIFGPYKNVSASRIPLSIHFLSTLTVVTHLPLSTGKTFSPGYLEYRWDGSALRSNVAYTHFSYYKVLGLRTSLRRLGRNYSKFGSYQPMW